MKYLDRLRAASDKNRPLVSGTLPTKLTKPTEMGKPVLTKPTKPGCVSSAGTGWGASGTSMGVRDGATDAGAALPARSRAQFSPPPLTVAQERARREVLEDLRDLPHLNCAFRYREERDTVILTLGIRGIATGELIIPAEKFDPAILLAHLNGE
jgi:hypothetical protein